MHQNHGVTFESVLPLLEDFWKRSQEKILLIEETCPPDAASPVFTVQGKYQARGWTEWTRGFQYGSMLLQFDATDDEQMLSLGRQRTMDHMESHVTHFGVHDHGFNNVSTFGCLRRLGLEKRFSIEAIELRYYELALRASAAIQASRWTALRDGLGYIYSFNGPHSLFADTMRSLRSLALGFLLNASVKGENDSSIDLLDRLISHGLTTARYSVYFGQGRDHYDQPGRVAHEAVFNLNDRRFRCPNSQQGYSPFTTWTRGLAWVMLGFAEQLEFLASIGDRAADQERLGEAQTVFEAAMRATCDFYLTESPADGIPYWDTGAPGLAELGDYRQRPADPFNPHEPVDSSAAAIAAQALLRAGQLLKSRESDSDRAAADRYTSAGLAIFQVLLNEQYLSPSGPHQGLLLHSVYHRPNGWDYTPQPDAVPRGESCLWGDYHLRELALYAGRLARGANYTFYGSR